MPKNKRCANCAEITRSHNSSGGICDKYGFQLQEPNHTVCKEHSWLINNQERNKIKVNFRKVEE